MKNKPCLSDENIRRLGEDAETVINTVVDEFSESDRVLSKWKTKILKYYELYQMVQKRKHYQGLSDIFVPELLRAVETIVGKIYGIIFAQPDWFEYAERADEFDIGGSLALTSLTKYQMEENSFKSRIMDSIRQMVIAGLTVRKIGWDYDEVERTIPGKPDSTGRPTRQKRIDTIKDTWTFEPVDILTLQISDVDTPYNNIQKARWIGEQYIATKVLVDEKMHRGWFSDVMKDKLLDQPKPNASSVTSNVKSRLMSAGFGTVSAGLTSVSEINKYELIERWGLVPAHWVCSKEVMEVEGLDRDDLIEGVVVIANRTCILKLERNPFWHNQKPYVFCPYVPKEFEFAGIGACQIGESLQEEINDTRNQTMDNKTLILSCMWLRSKTSGIKNDSLRVRPNGVIDTMDMEGLLPLRPPMVTQVGTSVEGNAKNDLREGVGAASNLQGIAQTGVDTATESTQINNEAMGRLLLTATLYSELVLKPLLVFAEFLNYQYYDHLKAIDVIGKVGVKFKKLTIAEIAGGHKNVIIRIDTDGQENPAIKRQQFMTFFGLVQQMPPQAIEFHYAALNKAYGMFFNGHDLSELYPNPNPDPEQQLSKEEERDMVIASQPVLATTGQNHQEYLKYHEKEFEEMKYGLDSTQFEIYHKLILSHYAKMQAEAEKQHQQMMQQQAEAEQAQGSSRGKSPNSSPNTMTPAPTVGSMTRGIA